MSESLTSIIQRLGSREESVAALRIAKHRRIGKSGLAGIIEKLRCKQRIDFKVNPSARHQHISSSSPQNGVIESQRVAIGHKERRSRLIIKNISFELRFLTLGNIWRIAHNDIKLHPGKRFRQSKDVGLAEIYIHM